jgi:uncharacterized membrane protein YgcG
MDYDDKSVAAALIDCAVKGAVTLSREKKTYTITRASGASPGTPLSPEETALLSGLVAPGQSLNLDQERHETIASAREAFRQNLKFRLEGTYFHAHRGWFYAGVALSSVFLALAGAALFFWGTESEATLGLLAATGGWTLVLWVLMRRIRGYWTSARGSGAFFPTLRALIATILAIPLLLVEAGLAFMLALFGGPLMAVSIVTLAAINPIFARLLKAPTPEGRDALDELEGFRMYLSAAERDRMNLLNPPERTPELFERFLPYALALDVEQRWGEGFSDVLARAGNDQPGGYHPIWWIGGNAESLSSGSFASSLGNSLAGSISSASTAPGSSSGGSGGGSSGGGGGGGGGGGW